MKKRPPRAVKGVLSDEAERGGFEPPSRVTPTTRIPAVLLQPLGHLSVDRKRGRECTESPGACQSSAGREEL